MKFNKYRNKKTIINGITFDSKREAERYKQLIFLEEIGKIKNLQTQVAYILQEGFTLGKKKYREIKYIADFVYQQKNDKADVELWEEVVEDCKGMRTEVYKIKKKMFMNKYQVEIKES